MQLSKNDIQFQRELVLKVHARKKSRIQHSYRLFISVLGVEQPVEYDRSLNRAFYEAMSLLDYDYFGFNAPKLIWLRGNTLCMTRLSGYSLESTDLNNNIISQLFSEMNERHFVASKNNAPRLIQLDSNFRNILISNDGISRLDFEMGRPYEPIPKLCTREISKTFVSLCKSRVALDVCVSKLCDIYFDTHLLRKWALDTLRKHSDRESYLHKISTEFLRCLGER